MEHDEDCIKVHGYWYLKKKDFENKYPDYCEFCNGWGGVYSFHNPSSSKKREFNKCFDCLGVLWCPRCCHRIHKDSNFDLEVITCKNCEWAFGCEGIPVEPQCNCSLKKEEKEDGN